MLFPTLSYCKCPHSHFNTSLQNDNDCPPYIGGALKDDFRQKRLTLDDLASTTISLITVSYRTPQSLANGVASWNASGLLELVDQKVRHIAISAIDGMHEGPYHAESPAYPVIGQRSFVAGRL